MFTRVKTHRRMAAGSRCGVQQLVPAQIGKKRSMTGCSRIRVENADILRGGKSQLRVPYLRKIAEQEGARSKNENFVRSCICYLPSSSSSRSSSAAQPWYQVSARQSGCLEALSQDNIG